MHSTFTAFIDANVFFGVRLRSLFMEVAQSGLFRAKWSEDIHREWIGAVVRRRPDLSAERLRPIADCMDLAVPDAMVSGYEGLMPALHLPDPDDTHVLAAAIIGRADVIVTFNENDFPEEIIAPYGLHTKHPDDFLLKVEGLDLTTVIDAAERDRKHYTSPTLTLESYTDDLAKAGVPKTAAYVRRVVTLLNGKDAPKAAAIPQAPEKLATTPGVAAKRRSRSRVKPEPSETS